MLLHGARRADRARRQDRCKEHEQKRNIGILIDTLRLKSPRILAVFAADRVSSMFSFLKKSTETVALPSGANDSRPAGAHAVQIGGIFGGARLTPRCTRSWKRRCFAPTPAWRPPSSCWRICASRPGKRASPSAANSRSRWHEALETLIAPLERPLAAEGHRPFIIMLAGVNGAGKTTSIGKLAKYFQAKGKKRAARRRGIRSRRSARAACIWGERNQVAVITQQGGDPAAVIFDAIQAARARKIDIVLADTAGRLPTQLHLMEEIRKVKRVIAKAEAGAPHEVLLVLDANTGQNALNQVKAFDAALG